MKKFIGLMVALILVLSLCACGGQPAAEQKAESGVAAETDTKEATEAAVETDTKEATEAAAETDTKEVTEAASESADADSEGVIQEKTSFSQWNPDAPSLQALIRYIETVTDEASPDYIPPEDRIATFDMDGTLIGELFPTYLEVILLEDRILRDPNYAPDAEMLEFGRMTREHALDKSFPDDYDYQFSYHQAKAFEGMTLLEYRDFIMQVLLREADGFEGMTYAEGYYLPMAEVVEYLQENDFKCYIITGTDRFIARAFMEGAMDIPDENIIGSDTELRAKDQGDTDGIKYEFTGNDTLVRTDKLLIKDLKTNKVVQIAKEIGKQPVLSFGNSSGDVSMHNYALYNNPYKSAVFQLIADDDARDYGNPEKGAELRKKWEDMGFNVISMRDDWKTIYGEDVKKTGHFNWNEDFAEDRIPADSEKGEVTQADIEKNIVGTWVKSEVDGKPVLTNEKIVFDIVSTTGAYESISQTNGATPFDEATPFDAATPFSHNDKGEVDINGNVVTITLTNPNPDVKSVENKFTITGISDSRFTANRKFTLVIEGTDPLVREETVTFVKVNDDYSDDIIGTWEGRCTSEGSIFDDGQDHRWEFKNDGTYVYYVKNGDSWVPSEDTMNEYFVAGNLLCSRWMENGQENREWWELSIDGDKMNWTALREGEDGKTFTATFEMKRIKG